MDYHVARVKAISEKRNEMAYDEFVWVAVGQIGDHPGRKWLLLMRSNEHSVR